jgi:hypothetical protein
MTPRPKRDEFKQPAFARFLSMHALAPAAAFNETHSHQQTDDSAGRMPHLLSAEKGPLDEQLLCWVTLLRCQ